VTAGRGGPSLVAGIACVLIGMVLCLDQLDVLSIHSWAAAGWSDAFIWPLVLAIAGAGLLWAGTRRPARSPEAPPYRYRVEPRQAGAEAPSDAETRILDLYRGGFGVALVIGAALLFLTQIDALGAARDAAFTSIVAIFALALILAPFIWRLGRNLADERSERVRSQERAEMAAHLHDSVLQTLTLMQKRADDPREVAALARRQERELRSWLAREEGAGSGGFAAALRAAAEEVEDAYLVKIDVVTVGDRQLDEAATAVVGAAREALTNAAKFAGETPISVYAEAAEGIEAFVRDRGPGFDQDEIPADRRGVRESIVGRMQRHGGDATITAVPGAGTEVALKIGGGW
jgi:signal transduction histidine kinase